MKFLADLHIHSKYSRATSKDMSPEGLAMWAQLKGITVIGTGDFTHPAWLSELKEKLVPADNGLLMLKKDCSLMDVPSSCKRETYFALTAEVSSIYRKNGKTRKIHNIILAPDFSAAEQINKHLSVIGNLSSDGRPILGLDAKELLKIVLDTSADSMMIPAHAWTPHFSVFGAMSGFDSLDECFEDLTPFIYAIETGLSSDPPMNWRLSSLDSITLISNSDAHSLAKLGREATIFDADITYYDILQAIKTGKGISGTIEYFPEEGKYHYDGHRICGVRMHPEETRKHHMICPVCGKKVTIGVLNRIETLADRENGDWPRSAREFHSRIPLLEIISVTINKGVNTKTVRREYLNILAQLGSELPLLMDVPFDTIRTEISSELALAIEKSRKGKVAITPGFDGEYGKVEIVKDGAGLGN